MVKERSAPSTPARLADGLGPKSASPAQDAALRPERLGPPLLPQQDSAINGGNYKPMRQDMSRQGRTRTAEPEDHAMTMRCDRAAFFHAKTASGWYDGAATFSDNRLKKDTV